MASPDFHSTWTAAALDSFGGSFNIHIEEGNSDNPNIHIEEGNSDNPDSVEITETPVSNKQNIPKPPPLPNKFRAKTNHHNKISEYCSVPKETRDTWDKLFKVGYGADVFITTDDDDIIPAHFSILSVASPILGNILLQSKVKNGRRCIKIPGPYDAVCAFVRFLYSSCYEEDEMKKFALHLLLLSHSFSAPVLKRVCENALERGWLSTENVIDVLQLARKCDSPRLSFICSRMVLRDFKTISSTEAWKVMRRSDPALERKLIELVVEEDSRRQERLKKNEEKKVYLQLHEAMEALLHICRDGCGKIGPCDDVRKGSQVPCSFPACKGLQSILLHFSSCKPRVPGRCPHCKRMWQLLELHSRMCNDPDYCKVPLCRHFKEVMRQQSKKDDRKWKLLVNKVVAARNALGPFSSRRML